MKQKHVSVTASYDISKANKSIGQILEQTCKKLLSGIPELALV